MKIQKFISTQPMNADEMKAHQERQMKEAAQSYEKYFLNEMVKAMRSTVHKEDGLIKQNFAEQIFSENLDQEYVDNWSKSGGVGLADLIYQQLQETITGKSGPPVDPSRNVANKSKGIELYQKEANPMKKLDD